MQIEDIAQELIELKQNLDRFEKEYQSKRIDMYNKLTNTQQESIECNGYKFSKTKEVETKTISKEKLWEALTNSGINGQLRSDIFSNSQNETTRFSTIRMAKLK